MLPEGQGEAAEVDVLEDASIEALIGGIRADRHGRSICCTAMSALAKAAPSEQTSGADWRRFSDANLTSLHVASQAVLPSMRAARRAIFWYLVNRGYPRCRLSASRLWRDQGGGIAFHAPSGRRDGQGRHPRQRHRRRADRHAPYRRSPWRNPTAPAARQRCAPRAMRRCRWAAWAAPRKSPRLRFSWPLTAPPTLPGPSWSSMAG